MERSWKEISSRVSHSVGLKSLDIGATGYQGAFWKKIHMITVIDAMQARAIMVTAMIKAIHTVLDRLRG